MLQNGPSSDPILYLCWSPTSMTATVLLSLSLSHTTMKTPSDPSTISTVANPLPSKERG